MICPNCGHEWLHPERQEGTRREYECWKCGFRFTTVETIVEVAERQAFQAALWRVVNGKKNESQP